MVHLKLEPPEIRIDSCQELVQTNMSQGIPAEYLAAHQTNKAHLPPDVRKQRPR